MFGFSTYSAISHLKKLAAGLGAFAAAVLASAVLAAAPPVEIVGLFKGRAVVRVDGHQQVMRPGDRTRSGVELVSADAEKAVFQYRGERFERRLSQRVNSSFQAAKRAELSIPADALGQYRVNGTIDGHYVSFLVDTGASVVAMSSRTAERIGLDYLSGQQGIVETAQGRTRSYFLDLKEVDVGGLKARNVKAAVISGDYPTTILLGMSYLREVKVTEANGVLSMTRGY